VTRASHDRIAISTTKLIKLPHLIDCEYFQWQRQTLTEAPWVFFHYGPYCEELVEVGCARVDCHSVLPRVGHDDSKRQMNCRKRQWRLADSASDSCYFSLS
jgi:hypothetical protein